MKRKLLVAAVVVVVVAIALAIWTHVSMKSSEAFAAADRFLRASTDLEKLIGSVQEISISNTGESSINERGNDGDARFSLSVVGSHKAADADVRLTRDLKVWSVESARVRVDGQQAVVSLPPLKKQ